MGLEEEEGMVGQCKSRFQGEDSVGGGSARLSVMEVNVIVHRPYIKVGQR